MTPAHFIKQPTVCIVLWVFRSGRYYFVR